MLRVKSLSATVSAVYEVLDHGSARFEVKILLLRLGVMEIGGKLFNAPPSPPALRHRHHYPYRGKKHHLHRG